MRALGIRASQFVKLPLGLFVECREIDAVDTPVLDHNPAIDDDGLEIATGAAEHHGLNGVDELAQVETVQVENSYVRLGTDREAAEIGPP